MPTFVVTSIYAGLLAILLLVLGGLVIRWRVVYKVDLGDGGKPELLRAIRALGNFAEYVPLALIVIALVEAGGHRSWTVHALGGGLLVGRLLHAWGLSTKSGESAGRFLGTILTFLVLLLGGLLLVAAGGWGVRL
jgi:hypothetical protein